MATTTPSQILYQQISAHQTLALRQSVLWPDLPLAQLQLAEDDQGFHFGAFVANESAPVAVISLFKQYLPLDDPQSGPDENIRKSEIRFRKFACSTAHQGHGIGTALLSYVIEYVRSTWDMAVLWCDARTTATEWYRKRGLTTHGTPFYKSGVEYVRMRMEITDQRPRLDQGAAWTSR